MNWINEFFNKKKAVIGLVHFKALPGDPHYNEEEGMEAVLKAARYDLHALQNGGVDGILFSNEFSLPYPKGASFEMVSAMSYLIGALKNEIKIPFGVHLIGDAAATLCIAASTGAKFTRGTYHGVYSTSGGLMDTDGAAIHRLRHTLRIDDFKLVYYVNVESSNDIGGRDPIEALRPIYKLDNPDALGVTGAVAGCGADMSLMKRVRESFPNAIIFATTGVNAETVKDVFAVADAAFVGSTFKKDGIFENPIDENRVRIFMDKVNEISI
ncbi:MAG: BtpA/SgcQ family protein [Bacilli bacterium]